MRVSAVDLFAGPGGWDQALRDIAVRDVVGIEWDAAACDTARAAGHDRIRADVTACSPQAFGGGVTGLVASPPCGPFAQAGKKTGLGDVEMILATVAAVGQGFDLGAMGLAMLDPRSALVLQPLRWAIGLDVDWLAWEQVPAVLPMWDACADALAHRGYHTWSGILHAEQFGVPQTRRRAVLLARRDSTVAHPQPTHSRYYPRDPLRIDLPVAPWVPMAKALGWPIGGPTAANEGTTDEQMNWVFHRPSPTIVGSFSPDVVAAPKWRKPGDGPRQKASGSVRITLEQAGILQSFPADYPWRGPKTAQWRQVGDAIPPGMARAALLAVGAS